MRLRHITKSIKTQNWWAIAIDFLIVVIGVFVGLQAQEWNRQRLDRIKEQTYLDRLASDFARIDDQLRSSIGGYERSLEAIGFVSHTLAAQTRREAASDVDATAFKEALINLTWNALPVGRSATFVELISSGELGLLRDEELRSALIAYDQQVQKNRDSWQSTQTGTLADTTPLYRTVDLHIDLAARPFASIRNYDLEAMARDRDFQVMLDILAGTKANHHALFQRQRELAEEVRDLVDMSR